MKQKRLLRREMRAIRRDAVAALPQSTRALVLNRPPAALAAMLPDAACVAIYHALADEAPTMGLARWFFDSGYALALPRFAERGAPMEFRAWDNPWSDDGLEPGPFAIPQPRADAAAAQPALALVPLLAFTADGRRLGQGGGHYDRWLAMHPDCMAIGLAWDAQLRDDLPIEAHDIPLAGVLTPTRLYRMTD